MKDLLEHFQTLQKNWNPPEQNHLQKHLRKLTMEVTDICLSPANKGPDRDKHQEEHSWKTLKVCPVRLLGHLHPLTQS